MKIVLKIFKFAIIFLITLELLSQIVGFQQNERLYALGSYPYMKTPPLKYWQTLYKKVLKDTTSYYAYDSLTGWTNRPNTVSKDGLYHFNHQGIRSDRAYSATPSEDTIRLLLLGNSAVFSAEVADTSALGYHLEKKLLEKGYAVEVLNMGVGSFGNDQSLLRWRHKAKAFEPDVVIQGVHLWDFWINLNIYKYCMFPPTGIIYTKPRGYLEGDSLLFANCPTVPTEAIYDSIILGYESQSFYEYEYFKTRKRYGRRWFDNLYLYQVLKTGKEDFDKEIDTYPDGKPLMLRLINQMQAEVEATNAEYVMLKLASYHDVLKIKYLNQRPNFDFWEELEHQKTFFSTFDTFLEGDENDLFVPSRSHYSGKGNRLIATAFASFLIENDLLKKRKK